MTGTQLFENFLNERSLKSDFQNIKNYRDYRYYNTYFYFTESTDKIFIMDFLSKKEDEIFGTSNFNVEDLQMHIEQKIPNFNFSDALILTFLVEQACYGDIDQLKNEARTKVEFLQESGKVMTVEDIFNNRAKLFKIIGGRKGSFPEFSNLKLKDIIKILPLFESKLIEKIQDPREMRKFTKADVLKMFNPAYAKFIVDSMGNGPYFRIDGEMGFKHQDPEFDTIDKETIGKFNANPNTGSFKDPQNGNKSTIGHYIVNGKDVVRKEHEKGGVTYWINYKDKEKLLESKVYEAPIAYLPDNTVSFDIRIDSTVHSEERKTRHSTEHPITDEQIVEVIKKALEPIAKDQLTGEDDLGQKYHIYAPKYYHLNIIGQFGRDKGKLVFRVITVMETPKFYPSADAKTIKVN